MRRPSAKRILKIYIENGYIKMSDHVRKSLILDIENALDDAWEEGHNVASKDYDQWKLDNLIKI